MVTLGNKEFFPGIGKIQFEGNKSTNPLAFRYYDENRKIGGKSMKDHFRFAVAYWHSFCAGMKDQFGSETRIMPWMHFRAHSLLLMTYWRNLLI